jgi:hypothetical protein
LANEPVATAARLPPEQAHALLDPAKEAFGHAMHAGAFGRLMLTYTAAQAFALLPHRYRPAEVPA